MRRPLVAGNWKMNGSRGFAQELISGLRDLPETPGPEMVVFPPSIFVRDVVEALGTAEIGVGVQNVHAESSGAFTGELSPEMAADAGASYALVGHSERRELYGENDEVVAAKFAAALRAGLVPVLCVGERLEQRESGQAVATVLGQLDEVLVQFGVESLRNAVVAYEPVWAIGTGQTATPADAQQMHAAVRERVGSESAEVAAGLRILYGGSVNADSAGSLFAQADVDGGLVGGASLAAGPFGEIYRAAQAANG